MNEPPPSLLSPPASPVAAAAAEPQVGGSKRTRERRLRRKREKALHRELQSLGAPTRREVDATEHRVETRERGMVARRLMLEKLFEMFDEDGDGFLSKEELRALARRTGGDVDDAGYTSLSHLTGAPPQGLQLAHLEALYALPGTGDLVTDFERVVGVESPALPVPFPFAGEATPVAAAAAAAADSCSSAGSEKQPSVMPDWSSVGDWADEGATLWGDGKSSLGDWIPLEEAMGPETPGLGREQLARAMRDPSCIRNVVMIADVDAGKSTVSDALLARAGVISTVKAGRDRWMDSLPTEQARGCTISASAVTLPFRLPEDLPGVEGPLVMNLIDAPGHADFSAEVKAALKVCDGALVVVDCVEGMREQTERMLHQTLAERIIPCLALNKIDRLFTQLLLTPEEAYQRLLVTVDAVQGSTEAAMLSESDGLMGIVDTTMQSACKDFLSRSVHPDPTDGSVVFAAALHGWGFTLWQWAKLYEKRLGVAASRLVPRLWGDHYWDGQKRWLARPQTEKSPRGFCQLILQPIYQIMHACSTLRWDKLADLLEVLWPGRHEDLLKDRRREGNQLFTDIMRALFPLAGALVEASALRLPSPLLAQPYRTDVLCTAEPRGCQASPRDAVARCDSAGPLVAYVAKLFPVSRSWGFYAFGRVFSGCIRPGAKVIIATEEGAQRSERSFRVQVVALMMGPKQQRAPEVPAGSLMALTGVTDGFDGHCATLFDPAWAAVCTPLRVPSPPAALVRVAIEAEQPSDRVSLARAVRWMERADPAFVCEREAGQTIVCASGELHLEIVLAQLRLVMTSPPGFPAPLHLRDLKVSTPAVPLRETVASVGRSVVAKQAGRNRIWARAMKLSDGLPEALEDRGAPLTELLQRFGWSGERAACAWAECGANVLVAAETVCAAATPDARASVAAAFTAVCKGGVLCGEPLRGVLVEVQSMELQGLSVAETADVAGRAVKGSVLAATPALAEPVFGVEVDTKADVAAVCAMLSSRGGLVQEVSLHPSGFSVVRAHVPVASAFGLNAVLRDSTRGRACASCSFSHWRTVPGELLQMPSLRVRRVPSGSKKAAACRDGSDAAQLLAAVRQRKGLAAGVPCLSDYADVA
eukprot:TRINITY_DN1589_c0_g1_i1.p1 TRINITY_DN1589_c0_g1~~TRINITY_DN1589_c0_g1_i1.p1  ORF type:complete len:1127 (+),score=249.69 TRINITY_DN1589_c0_g1_i1:72-3383(+)